MSACLRPRCGAIRVCRTQSASPIGLQAPRVARSRPLDAAPSLPFSARMTAAISSGRRKGWCSKATAAGSPATTAAGLAMGDDAGALRGAARRRRRPAAPSCRISCAPCADGCLPLELRISSHAAPCAACPLRSFPFGAHHVCRDECVALGLIAALQHDDPGRCRTSALRRSPARRARPTSPRRRPALPTRWPARATIFCRSRKARSKMCFHVPAPRAAPFTEEMTMTTTSEPRAAFRTAGRDRRLDGADGRDLRAAGQGRHRSARR